MEMRGRFGLLALVILSGATGFVSTGAARAAQPSRVVIEMKPASPRVGQTVTVNIVIRNALDVGSVPFTLLYDANTLELSPALAPREGKFLGRDGTATTFLTAPSPQGAGPGLIVGLSRLRSDRGARGKGVVCSLSFRARAAGQGQFKFSNASVLNPHAEKLAATFTGRSFKVRPAP